MAVSVPLLGFVRRGDRAPAKQSDWKPELQSLFAFLLWLALYFAVGAISIGDQMRSP